MIETISQLGAKTPTVYGTKNAIQPLLSPGPTNGSAFTELNITHRALCFVSDVDNVGSGLQASKGSIQLKTILLDQVNAPTVIEHNKFFYSLSLSTINICRIR